MGTHIEVVLVRVMEQPSKSPDGVRCVCRGELLDFPGDLVRGAVQKLHTCADHLTRVISWRCWRCRCAGHAHAVRTWVVLKNGEGPQRVGQLLQRVLVQHLVRLARRRLQQRRPRVVAQLQHSTHD